MAEPTPRPWKVVSDSYNVTPDHGWAVADSEGRDYLATYLNYANAEHIVRCVNNFDELVAALEMELEYHDGDAGEFWNKYGDLTRDDRVGIIRRALARARGEVRDG